MKKTNRNYLIVTGFVLAFLLGVTATYAVMSTPQRISNTAKIKGVGVGVYAYSNKTVPVSSIDWGLVEPGQSKNFTCYVFNEGNAAINLSMTTENWVPNTASTYITLSWNYAGSQIPAGAYVPVTFNLAVSSSIQAIETFSFTIVLTGSG